MTARGRFLSVVIALVAALPLAADADADASVVRDPVRSWVAQHAQPFRPAELAHSVRRAGVVGLGESVHGAREQTAMKAGVLRALVQRYGFRTVAWEEDWTTGRRIDRYLTSGRGHVVDLVSQMTGQWRSRETVRLLRWLRSVNTRRSAAEQVRFVGVEYYYTGPPAYDAVERYVKAERPDLLPQVRRQLRLLRPSTEDMQTYVEWYSSQADTSRYVVAAHRLAQLVRRVRPPARVRARAMVLHHVRQIVSFHEHYALPLAEQDDYREAHAAANLAWWQRRSGDRIVYWAASPHTAAAPRLRIALPGPDFTFASTGSFLRDRYGAAYASVGFTLDHGTVGLAPDETANLPAPDPRWFESTLAAGPDSPFLLDLGRPAPPAVQRWSRRTLRSRGLPQAGPDSFVTGGAPAQWFDLLVHVQQVSPLHALRH